MIDFTYLQALVHHNNRFIQFFLLSLAGGFVSVVLIGSSYHIGDDAR